MTTSEAEDWPDIEGALRTWLRADPDIQAVVGNRVFFGVPRNSADAFPLYMITRIGGGITSSEVPIDNALMQIDCYARKSDEGGGRAEATALVNALRKALSKIRGKSRLNDTVVAYDPRVSSVVFSPLPGDDRPRYLVTFTLPSIYNEVLIPTP